MKWGIAVAACAACGRVGFDAPDAASVQAGRCATAMFANPAASSISDDFSSGSLAPRWMPVDPCIAETGGELVASPLPSGRYCHAWTIGDFHLSCDTVAVHVPQVTAQDLGVQTFMYIGTLDGTSSFDVLLEAGGIQFGSPDLFFSYDMVADAWWRVSESDGEMTIDTAPDGTTWTRRAMIAEPWSMDHVQIALGAGTYKQVTSPGQARFHCYNVPPPCE